MRFEVCLYDLAEEVHKARAKGVKLEEIRIDPEVEQSLLVSMPPQTQSLKTFMGIKVVVDPLCPPGTIYIGPKLEVETEMEVSE